jgi:hypothetical protein
MRFLFHFVMNHLQPGPNYPISAADAMSNFHIQLHKLSFKLQNNYSTVY